MKIVSWNVNGIRAAWNHGLSAFLRKSKADIYALQETKINSPYYAAELNGYYPYWSYCERRSGYSGTLCLTRGEPAAVSYDMFSLVEESEIAQRAHEFDYEGRIITLEYGNFYLVNVYYPNSQRSAERYDYRSEWDALLFDYLRGLKKKKSTIVCGDFNVAISDDDIYPGNKWIEINAEGFQATERENLIYIIQSGFTDSYRHIHPDETGVYSWWSNRRNKRKENKGWRLDYILTTDDIVERITEATMLTDVMGSDHCPVMLDLDMPTEALSTSKYPSKKKKSLAEIPFTDRESYMRAVRNSDLAAVWDSLEWDKIEETVSQMQMTLAKAAYSRDAELITRLQKRIVYSLEAKLLAVRHVCNSNGGTGVDNVKWHTSREKMSAALALTSKGYKALPARLLMVKSKNGKTRRIHIETWHDRAMQTLYALSLDPVAESWGDRKSFAFRKGRSFFDLNEYIKEAFTGSADAVTEWAFIGDVHQCYEHISHDWIIEHIPMAKYVLQEFLLAGYIFAGEVFPTNEGVGIGLSLSPIIANMVLDGLQEYIYRRMYPDAYAPNGERDDSEIDFPNGNLIRYADDIIVAARSKDDAERIRTIITDFLRPRGLELSDAKSKIVNVRNGFDFMSRFYIKNENTVYVYPSEGAVGRFMDRLKDTIENHTGSQSSLITKLNRMITGWATYHKVEDAGDVFRKIDVYIKALLLQSCSKKHPKWDRDRILAKYWYQEPNGRYRYALPDKKEVAVKYLSDTILVRHNKVKTNMNPYIEREYLEWREQTRAIYNVTGIYRAIWNRQEGKCYYCGRPFLRDQEKMLTVINSDAVGKVHKYGYVHLRCMDIAVDIVETDTLPYSTADIMSLLEHLQNATRPQGQKFLPLSEFFRTCNKSSVTMTFAEIEKILGWKLGKSAKQRSWWHRTGFENISQSWLDNGYEIRNLHIDRRKVVFHRVSMNTSSVNIPDVFITERIPDAAKYELENYFAYIIKKYGL